MVTKLAKLYEIEVSKSMNRVAGVFKLSNKDVRRRENIGGKDE